jgi:hypothetical protein
MRSLAKSWGLFATAAALTACATKEAEDPRKILGEDAAHNGVSGLEGARGSAEPRSPRAAGEPARGGAVIATQAECEAAARRVEELALRMAVDETDDPDERTKLETRRRQELSSAAFKARVERAGKDCVARETTSTEARCIARAQSEMDIQRCGER